MVGLIFRSSWVNETVCEPRVKLRTRLEVERTKRVEVQAVIDRTLIGTVFAFRDQVPSAKLAQMIGDKILRKLGKSHNLLHPVI